MENLTIARAAEKLAEIYPGFWYVGLIENVSTGNDERGSSSKKLFINFDAAPKLTPTLEIELSPWELLENIKERIRLALVEYELAVSEALETGDPLDPDAFKFSKYSQAEPIIKKAQIVKSL